MQKVKGSGKNFFLACAAGLVLATAMAALADDYEQGLSFHQNQNYAQSLPLFRRAAEQGDARAQFSIAYMYSAGQGVPQDFIEAYKWVMLAEAKGHEHASGLRALLEKYMPPEQLALARERARQPPDVPVPTPRPIPEPAPAAALIPPAVSLALEAWRSAWSRRDAAAYLAAYAPDFKPSGSLSRARWEAQRRQRLARAARIEVRIENPGMRLAPDGSAIARFTQIYESDLFRESAGKSLVFGNYGGNWLIREESSAP